MKIVAIVQARMGSTRLPGKVMREILGMTSIEILLHRLQKSHHISEIVVATSTLERDTPLSDHVNDLGFKVFRGSETDVLDRFYQAALDAKADVVIRITGDCPLVDPLVVDTVIRAFLKDQVDYCSNIEPPTFPDGLDVEVMAFEGLSRSHQQANSRFEREHVTPILRKDPSFLRSNVTSSIDYSSVRLTLDEKSDFDLISSIFQHFSPDLDFGWLEAVEWLNSQPELKQLNSNIERDEGATMGTGQKLWKRAKEIIPGGNMLLTKRSEMFLPEIWPSYFSKTSGCHVWDMDGNKYADCGFMGVGSNTLGYSNSIVDEAVMGVVRNGNMSTLNAPEEVYLAEALVDLHPWAHMVRFARSGGEANAIAIRIARAASQKDGVAVCGYHGWHDWYLSANLSSSSNLATHLLEGLSPDGVPKGLSGLTHPFEYNDFDALKAIVQANDIGVIKMEVQRNAAPKNNFLQKVRDLADTYGIVLVFDECTSGFRQTNGGLHLMHGVEPDIAVFGKTLGNGYAVSAVIGKDAVMQAAQNTFISSTFWTERIGSVAGIASLKEIARTKSWETITEIGGYVAKKWQEIAEAENVPIWTSGLSAISTFSFQNKDRLEFKTYYTQEMLKRGYLATTAFYASTAHTANIVESYLDATSEVFKDLGDAYVEKIDIQSKLDGPVCHDGFKRLN